MYKANICRALLLWGSVSWWVTAITQSRADDRPRQPSVWRYASLSSQIHLCHESVFWCSLGFVSFNKSHIQTIICSPTLLPFILVFITIISLHFCVITHPYSLISQLISFIHSISSYALPHASISFSPYSANTRVVSTTRSPRGALQRAQQVVCDGAATAQLTDPPAMERGWF